MEAMEAMEARANKPSVSTRFEVRMKQSQGCLRVVCCLLCVMVEVGGEFNINKCVV